MSFRSRFRRRNDPRPSRMCRRSPKPRRPSCRSIAGRVLVPGGTPQPIIDKLNRELVAALQSEAVAKPLADVGFEIVASAPGAFADVIKADVQRFGEIVRAANINVE